MCGALVRMYNKANPNGTMEGKYSIHHSQTALNCCVCKYVLHSPTHWSPPYTLATYQRVRDWTPFHILQEIA